MSSIILAAVPVHGHVTPLLAVARHFAERGDRVRFLTGVRFAEAVAATGAEHLPLPAEADYDDRELLERFPERDALKGAKAIAFDIEHVFIRPGRAQHDAIMKLHADESADAVLTDPAFAGGAFLLGHSLGARPPTVVCGVIPLTIASRDTAPYGMGLTPMPGPLGRLRNKLLSTVAARTVFPPSERIAQGVNRELHGRPLPFAVLDWPRHAEAIVQFTVPEFEYPRSDAPTTLHFVGPVSATGSEPLPPWWEELDGSRPVVHVTQGTIANRDYQQIIAPTLEALAEDDLLVVVSTGGRPLDTLPPLPANARAATYLPYDELLPKTDVYVTNGGYGGVQYALRYGVPIVTSSGKEDKPEVAARVAWSGVGRRLKTETPSPGAVGTAVRSVLREPAYRDSAQLVAASMARAGGVTRLAELVDGLAARPV
jgi:UDP:flavonoid glycosyltransferase YjiC (YdhE family)